MPEAPAAIAPAPAAPAAPAPSPKSPVPPAAPAPAPKTTAAPGGNADHLATARKFFPSADGKQPAKDAPKPTEAAKAIEPAKEPPKEGAKPVETVVEFPEDKLPEPATEA